MVFGGSLEYYFLQQRNGDSEILAKRLVVLASALVFALTVAGCSASEKVDPSQATIDCGIMVRLLGGEVRPSPENLDKLEIVVSGLATTSYRPIRNVANLLLPSFSGSDTSQPSKKDLDKAIEEFKSFCMDYTVD